MCFVGLIGSGKSTVAELLRRRGFTVIEMRDAVVEKMAERRIPMNSKNLREMAFDLRKRYGKDVVARYTAKKIRRSSSKTVALMGVRTTIELNYFRRKFGRFPVVEIYAPEKVRFGRIKRRRKVEDARTLKQFRWIENRENKGYMKNSKEARYGLKKVVEKADYVIANTGTKKALSAAISQTMAEIRRREG